MGGESCYVRLQIGKDQKTNESFKLQLRPCKACIFWKDPILVTIHPEPDKIKMGTCKCLPPSVVVLAGSAGWDEPPLEQPMTTEETECGQWESK